MPIYGKYHNMQQPLARDLKISCPPRKISILTVLCIQQQHKFFETVLLIRKNFFLIGSLLQSNYFLIKQLIHLKISIVKNADVWQVQNLSLKPDHTWV